MIERKPLTLEELQEMVGKPVWIERNDQPNDGIWCLVDHADTKHQDKTLYTKSGTTYSDYGKYFTAYIAELPHMNREAWKPCEVCLEGCRNCRNAEPYFYQVGLQNICRECTRKTNTEKPTNWTAKINFCPECGRPLKEEAWAMLEKRLGEMINEKCL